MTVLAVLGVLALAAVLILAVRAYTGRPTVGGL